MNRCKQLLAQRANLLIWVGVSRTTSGEKSVNKSVIMLEKLRHTGKKYIKKLVKILGVVNRGRPLQVKYWGSRPLQPLRRWRLCVLASEYQTIYHQNLRKPIYRNISHPACWIYLTHFLELRDSFLSLTISFFLEPQCYHGMIESEIMRLADARHATCSHITM